MAAIQEQHIVIKLSKLVKEGTEEVALFDAEFLNSLEQVAQQLLGEAVIVEIMTG